MHIIFGQFLQFQVISLAWLGGKMKMIIDYEKEKKEVQI